MHLDSLSASHIANHIADNQARASQLQSHPLHPAKINILVNIGSS